MVGTKRLIFVAIVVSVIGIGAGVFLANGLTPSRAAQALGQYDERVTTNKTVIKVAHEHDGLPQHEHVITTIVTTNETTPHGNFHDFALGGGQAPSPAASAVTPTPAPTVTTPTQGAREITVESREFRPSSLTIPVGTKVTWTNQDFEGHIVVSDTGLFNGDLGPGGGTFSYTFDTPGTFSYHCDAHPYMAGTIIVN